jgi:BirA family biotin operon repressor/biotin-[acetyl-CoA-carboxylase] ligase
MDNKQQILRQLREADGYLSGQHLSGRLGISRTAVWKIIGRLKKEGYPIEAVTNKGYRLLSVEGRDLFNREEIENRLQTEWAGHPLVFLTETGSTNADIFRLSDEGYPSGTLAVAAQQTAGKGRRGRTWISPPDVNVYMSILLKPTISPENAPMLTLVMALAVYQACEALYSEENVQFGIKWPNDIVVSRAGGSCRKICGILTEMRLEEKDIRDIVIGIGLNVNQDEFPEEIRETAGSLKLALGRDVGRAELTAEIWRHFEKDYEAFTEVQSLAPLKEEYERGLVNRGRRVRVLSPVDPFEGTAIGITDTGELTVRPDDGSPDREVASGEVSVRGVMGYV